MTKIGNCRLGIAALVLFGGLSATAAAGDSADWKNYRENLQKLRDQSHQQYRQWWNANGNSYKRVEQHDLRPFPKNRVLELKNPYLPEGSYDVKLPTGAEYRVRIPQTSGPPIQDGYWPKPVYTDVYSLARQLHSDLQQIEYGLQRLGEKFTAVNAADALRYSEAFLTAASQNAPSKALRAKFAEFDQKFHPLAFKMSNLKGIPQPLQQRMQLAIDKDQILHHRLRIGEAPVYDRVLLAGVTHQMISISEHMLQDLQREGRLYPDLSALLRSGRRINRQLQDLHAAIVDGASYSTVKAEYELFDEDFHRLLERLNRMNISSQHFQKVQGDIWELDRVLHRELFQNAGMILPRQRLLNLADRMQSTADRLKHDLQPGLPRSNSQVVWAIDNFSRSAFQVHQGYINGAATADLRLPIQQLRSAWARLQSMFPQIRNAPRYQRLRTTFQQLQSDMNSFDVTVKSQRS